MSEPKTTTDSPIVAVCCFKEDRYRWFSTPEPMTRREADRWAWQTLGMPAENYRTAAQAERNREELLADLAVERERNRA